MGLAPLQPAGSQGSKNTKTPPARQDRHELLLSFHLAIFPSIPFYFIFLFDRAILLFKGYLSGIAHDNIHTLTFLLLAFARSPVPNFSRQR